MSRGPQPKSPGPASTVSSPTYRVTRPSRIRKPSSSRWWTCRGASAFGGSVTSTIVSRPPVSAAPALITARALNHQRALAVSVVVVSLIAAYLHSTWLRCGAGRSHSASGRLCGERRRSLARRRSARCRGPEGRARAAPGRSDPAPTGRRRTVRSLLRAPSEGRPPRARPARTGRQPPRGLAPRTRPRGGSPAPLGCVLSISCWHRTVSRSRCPSHIAGICVVRLWAYDRPVMSAFGMDRGFERIADVSGRGSDLVTLWRDVAEIVTPLVPNLMGPCCFTLDPASLLMTSHFNPALYYELPEEMLRGEYLVDDVHDMASVARSPSGVSTIHAAAGGDPSASPRWQGNMALGGDQELLVSLRTRSGATWGTLGLYRGRGEEQFSADEIELLRVAAPALAEGVRRSLL